MNLKKHQLWDTWENKLEIAVSEEKSIYRIQQSYTNQEFGGNTTGVSQLIRDEVQMSVSGIIHIFCLFKSNFTWNILL